MDCKVRSTQFGYGAGGTWLTHCRTLAEFDAASEHDRLLRKNQNWRAFLAKHEGHNLEVWNEDYASVRIGVLEYDDNIGPAIDMRDFHVESPADIPTGPKLNVNLRRQEVAHD